MRSAWYLARRIEEVFFCVWKFSMSRPKTTKTKTTRIKVSKIQCYQKIKWKLNFQQQNNSQSQVDTWNLFNSLLMSALNSYLSADVIQLAIPFEYSIRLTGILRTQITVFPYPYEWNLYLSTTEQRPKCSIYWLASRYGPNNRMIRENLYNVYLMYKSEKSINLHAKSNADYFHSAKTRFRDCSSISFCSSQWNSQKP